MSTPAIPDQVALLRRFAIEQAADAELGRLWLRRLRDLGPELLQLCATQPRVREQTERMLAGAAALVENSDVGEPRVLDDEFRAVAEAALAALHDHGSAQMREMTHQARADLHAARGQSLRQALAAEPHRP